MGVSVPAVLPGYLDGLAMSWTSVTQVGIAIGYCADSTGATYINNTGALTATCGASTGANQRDTGTESSSTWYALYVCRGTSGVCSLLSESFTAPTLPSGYDVAFRRVGAVYNNSGSDLEDFIQVGAGRDRWVYWDDYTNFSELSAGGATTWTDVDCSSSAPETATELQFHYINVNNFGTTHSAQLRPNGAGAALVTLKRGVQSAQSEQGVVRVPCDSSQIVEYQMSASDASLTLSLSTSGYRDQL